MIFHKLFRRNVTAALGNALDSQPSVQLMPATPPAERKDGNKLRGTLMGVGLLISSHIIGFMFQTSTLGGVHASDPLQLESTSIPVVPHKAVAELSKSKTYRGGELV